MNESSVLLPRSELFSLPLGESRLGLTCEASDMGPNTDVVPSPMGYHRMHGLCLVDPGPSRAPKPSLQCFDKGGNRVLQVPLVKDLALSDPAMFKAHALFVDATGRASILFSAGYDQALQQEQDFALASFDWKGKGQGVVKLPGFKPSSPTYRDRKGNLWASSEESEKEYWAVYGPKGDRIGRFQALRSAELLPDDRLLVLSETLPAIHEATGKTTAVTLVNGYTSAAFSVVPGTGRFFGLLWSPQEEREHKEVHGKGRIEDKQMIQILTLDPATNSLHVLGTARLPSQIYEYREVAEGVETATHFELPAPMSFDEEGTLYLIVRRGPQKPAITVFRMALQKEIRDSLRRTGK